MNFFEGQDLARRNTKLLVVMYVLAVAAVIVAVDFVLASSWILALSDSAPRGAKPGWVVTNPPYGTRVGGSLKDIYAAVGRLAEPPWRLAVVGAQGSPTNSFGRNWEDSLMTRNGGIAVRFLRSGNA